MPEQPKRTTTAEHEGAAIDAARELTAKRIHAAADDAGTCLWDVETVARTALRGTERLAALEHELAAQAPTAAPRLAMIGDVVAHAAARIVVDHARHTARIARGHER
jgi:hypothetical protein